jgi:2-keto-3-deoxy-L-rhamnonate aldolase RhmA
MGNRVKNVSASIFSLMLLSLSLLAQDSSFNPIIENLQSGRPVIGTFTRTPSAELDFAIIDVQYGDFDIEEVRAAIAGMPRGNKSPLVAPIVRTPLAARDNPQNIAEQLLDAGAHGLMFPDVETKAQAMAAMTSMATDKGDVWTSDSNGTLVAMIQIESPRGIANLDEILEVPGIGVLFLGPTDMATAIGAEGPDAAAVEVMVQEVLAVCLARDIACGYPILATSAVDAERQTAQRLAEGFKVLAVMTRAR